MEFFTETRHVYGRSGMVFSGFGNFSFFHLGVFKALLNEGLVPKILFATGSASIVTAIIGTKTPLELQTILGEGLINFEAFQ